jgi:hypothetical protein
VVVGSYTGRRPETATCVGTAYGEDVTRNKRAAGRALMASQLGLFALVTVDR